jgi:hypothetical protein
MPVFWVLAAIGLAGDDGEKSIAPEGGAYMDLSRL